MPAPLAVPDPPDSKSLATCLSQDLLISRAGGGVRSGVHTFCKLAFPSILFPAGSSARPSTVCNTTTAYDSHRGNENCTIKPSLWSLSWCLFCVLVSVSSVLFQGQKQKQHISTWMAWLSTSVCRRSNQTLGYPSPPHSLASCLLLFIALYAGLLWRVTLDVKSLPKSCAFSLLSHLATAVVFARQCMGPAM